MPRTSLRLRLSLAAALALAGCGRVVTDAAPDAADDDEVDAAALDGADAPAPDAADAPAPDAAPPDAATPDAGVLPGALAVAPLPFDFGDVTVGGEAVATFTVTNVGEAPLPSPTFTLPSGVDFTVIAGTCGGQLAGGASCTVDVSFVPSRGGAVATTMTVASGSSTVVADLAGTGTATVRVTRAGTGAGVVVGAIGIDCGATCSAPARTATVTLVATPANGSLFDGWSLASCGTATTCTLPIDDDEEAVTATFRAVRTLTVMRSGNGAGTVTSSPAGINCGTDCNHVYNSGTSVTLTAAAGTNSAFERWSGACSGTQPTCSVTMSTDRTATAEFKTQFTLTLTLVESNTALGSVRVAPPNQDCHSGTCQFHYGTSTSVTLTAAQSTADCLDFVSWSGACTGSSTTCTVQMNTARSVTASFARIIGCTPQ